MDKHFYLAPMEGITGYIFRNAFNKFFGGFDGYITPFISPTQSKILNHKELEDILPEHNVSINIVPQILANNAQLFIKTVDELSEYGYREVNLNLGCPSGTVVTKYKGSGLLADLDRLDDFLYEIFNEVKAKRDIDISIKTRIGRDEPEEFKSLLVLFNQYPVKMLTIHPRVQKEFYKGNCHLDVFREAVEDSENPLCYNGDINSVEDYSNLSKMFQSVDDFMIGRGVLRNPNLITEIKNNFEDFNNKDINIEEKFSENKIKDNIEEQEYRKKLRAFLDEIYAGYEEIFSGDRNVLFKMKEIWSYLGDSFVGSEKLLKEVKKANSKVAYFSAVDRLFG